MIFQDPLSSLNPLYPVGDQIAEALVVHRGIGRRQALAEALELLRQVGIADPERRLREYPHQLSGGMRQRCMIAMALCCRPKLLIADEPTSALDATIQAQILDLLQSFRRTYRMALVLITHDLAVAADIAERMVILYAGQVAEQGPVEAVFARPLHPYTRGLLRATPRLDAEAAGARLAVIPGQVPYDFAHLPGCRFADRCPECLDCCGELAPPWIAPEAERGVRCWLHAGPHEEARR
jgi:oligopeptide/dipeptide ABC transporter ATP-binding protein